MAENEPKGLVMLWITRDKEAAQRMVLMYTLNSRLKGWWDRVHLVVWGPSAELLAQDEDLQKAIEDVQAAGVELFACKACSDLYGLSERLAELGIAVVYMGQPLTTYLKEGWATISV
jgi:hypothetical protein